MTGRDTSSSSSVTTDNKPLHPVYSVTNIQNKVRTLDGEKVTYTAWVKLFKLHTKGYEVLKHIDGTKPPAETDDNYEAWAKIDSIVLQWIYGTLSDDLLVRILDDQSTAQQAWNKLQSIFQNNKNSRASSLLQAFTNTTLSSCSSLNEYFQKLKDIAEQLKDVDQPVTESRLVLQMVQGLPPEYDTTASFINQSNTSWDDARDMIEREQRRQAARQQHSALAAPRNTSNPPSVPPAGANTVTTGVPAPPPSAYLVRPSTTINTDHIHVAGVVVGTLEEVGVVGETPMVTILSSGTMEVILSNKPITLNSPLVNIGTLPHPLVLIRPSPHGWPNGLGPLPLHRNKPIHPHKPSTDTAPNPHQAMAFRLKLHRPHQVFPLPQAHPLLTLLIPQNLVQP